MLGRTSRTALQYAGSKRRLQASAGSADLRGCQQRGDRSCDAMQRRAQACAGDGGADRAAAPAGAPPRWRRLLSGACAGREGVWAAGGALAPRPARPQLGRVSAQSYGRRVARRGLLRREGVRLVRAWYPTP